VPNQLVAAKVSCSFSLGPANTFAIIRKNPFGMWLPCVSR
jgi:hypothetical protein